MAVCTTVDFKKLEQECRMIQAGVPAFNVLAATLTEYAIRKTILLAPNLKFKRPSFWGGPRGHRNTGQLG